MLVPFSNEFVSMTVAISDDSDNSDNILIKGVLINPESVLKAELTAACPIDRMANYTGSGQPFANSHMAFEGTPNRAVLAKGHPNFEVTFKYPNSFYAEGGFDKIVSSVFLSLELRGASKPVVMRIELPDRNPLKSLTYRDEAGPFGTRTSGTMFYDRESFLPIPTSQYEQLINIGAAKQKYGIA
jgi:hypothetical protein